MNARKWIFVVKKDAETQVTVAGAVFGLYANPGDKDSGGRCDWRRLLFETCKAKEKEETQEDGEDLEFYDGGSYINEDQAEDEEPADKEDEEE